MPFSRGITVLCVILIGIIHDVQISASESVKTNHRDEEKQLMREILVSIPAITLQDVSVPYLWGTSAIELGDISLEGFWSARILETPLVNDSGVALFVFFIEHLSLNIKRYKIGVLPGNMDMVKYIGNKVRVEVLLMKSPDCKIEPVNSGVVLLDLEKPEVDPNTACAVCSTQPISKNTKEALNNKLYEAIKKKLPEAISLAIRKAKITNLPRFGCTKSP